MYISITNVKVGQVVEYAAMTPPGIVISQLWDKEYKGATILTHELEELFLESGYVSVKSAPLTTISNEDSGIVHLSLDGEMPLCGSGFTQGSIKMVGAANCDRCKAVSFGKKFMLDNASVKC